jgi:hypothetical protein
MPEKNDLPPEQRPRPGMRSRFDVLKNAQTLSRADADAQEPKEAQDFMIESPRPRRHLETLKNASIVSQPLNPLTPALPGETRPRPGFPQHKPEALTC